MKYYVITQTNVGGIFINPARNIIVEAENADEANELVVQYERPDLDCECCMGNRWEYVSDEDDRDMIDEDHLNKILLGVVMDNNYILPKVPSEINDYRIIYANGRVVDIKE